jgi:hypothetical protein
MFRAGEAAALRSPSHEWHEWQHTHMYIYIYIYILLTKRGKLCKQAVSTSLVCLKVQMLVQLLHML